MSSVLRFITSGLAAGFLIMCTLGANAQMLPKAGIPLDISTGIQTERSLPIVKIQNADQGTRVLQLEEQIRQLTGRLEELGFQMLQMQEQMRQMQEDNEFRFQDLERTKANDQSSVAPKADRTETDATNIQIGEVKVDANGNVTSQKNTSSDVESELYKAGYAQVLAGDYATAANTFRSYLAKFPNGAEAANANYWLGESLYSQGDFREAARIFLDGHKTFPESPKAPDTLLKLGMSLVALDNRETACATYDEVLVRYPLSSKAVKDKVASERSRAKC
ncbi:tol-pal system protein YbgF [Lentilitoribacter sp. Alg239-R112]|uniref:tol-pal system protein YbgF n=1 Tax=Lentilitoribacter sp. Alg239-R112 TaxID=2305987 RepID=UPI0013A6AAC2|nr:tol-pal system protein YbgF [Lentilitoribacter sp. Alg239-R112]